MAILPNKLVERLNNLYELGEFKFGNELQQCLTEIANTPTGGTCITVPGYTSQAAAEAACGKIPGNLFYNETTDALTFCDDNGNWIEMDWVNKCIQVDQNTTKITLNMDNITTLINQLTTLQTNFDNHNHDGINSPPVDIKNLITTAPAGQYFFSTGSGIDCGPIQQGIAIEDDGLSINTAASTIDFFGPCFDVTDQGGGEVRVDIPLLPQLKADVAMNAMCCTTNTTAISNLSTQIVAIQTQVNLNTTNITNNTNTIASHCHDGTDSVQIRIDKILSQDGTSTNLPVNFTVCSDGAGGWTYVDKATFSGTAVTLNNVGPGEDIVAATSTATNYDIKGIVPGCGIAVTSTATDIEVGVDFANMANVGTALDVATDTILVHDASTGECVQTSLQSLASTIGNKSFVGGKSITVTNNTLTNTCTFDLDLTTITPKVNTDEIDCANDYLVYYDASATDCKTINFDDVPVNQSCCLPDPGGFSLLDPVYIDPTTGAVTASDISDADTVAQFVIVGFKPGEVCLQDFGVVDLKTPHGLNLGECYFEGATGSATTTAPISGINNTLYQAISDTKITVSVGTRPYEISSSTQGIMHQEISPGVAGVGPISNSIGKIDQSWIKGVNQYPSIVAANTAGLNQNGCTYFDTTDNRYLVFLDDPCGNGTSGPNWVSQPIRHAYLSVRESTGQVLPNGVGQNVLYNQILSDTCSAYNAATGVYTIPDTGVYDISAKVSAGMTAGGTQHLLEVTLDAGGAGQWVGTQYNSSNYINSSATGIVSITQFFTAGTQIQIRAISVTNIAGDESLNGPSRNWLTITRTTI